MKRNTINFWIDALTLVAFVGVVWTGFLIEYVLPPGHGRGGGGGRGLVLWGWNRHDYGLVHYYLAIAMLVLILAHVWLHWAWVCNTIGNLLGKTKPQRRRRAILGILALLLFIGITVGGLFWVNAQVERVSMGRNFQGEAHDVSHIPYMGRRSLQEISQITGVPVERFITELKLPADVDSSEQLGRLRRWFRFEMNDVRNVIDEHQEK